VYPVSLRSMLIEAVGVGLGHNSDRQKYDVLLSWLADLSVRKPGDSGILS
jgi:hypothetical protein